MKLVYFYFGQYQRAIANKNIEHLKKRDLIIFFEKSGIFNDSDKAFKEFMYILVSVSAISLMKIGIKVKDIGLFNSTMFDLVEKGHSYSCYMNILEELYASVINIISSYSFTRHEEIIVQAIDYIESNLHNPLTLKDVAKQTNVSEQYLASKFKSKLNITVKDYIIKEKMKLAIVRIVRNDVNYEEVAFELGYDSYTTFYRTFKGYYGISPKSYSKDFESKVKNQI